MELSEDQIAALGWLKCPACRQLVDTLRLYYSPELPRYMCYSLVEIPTTERRVHCGRDMTIEFAKLCHIPKKAEQEAGEPRPSSTPLRTWNIDPSDSKEIISNKSVWCDGCNTAVDIARVEEMDSRCHRKKRGKHKGKLRDCRHDLKDAIADVKKRQSEHQNWARWADAMAELENSK